MQNFNNFIAHVWQDKRILDSYSAKANKQLQQIFSELSHTANVVLDLNGEGACSNALAQIGCDVHVLSDTNIPEVDTLVAFDEVFTYAASETEQFDLIRNAVAYIATGGLLLTSIRDYRNNPVHKRNIGDATSCQVGSHHYLIVEAQMPSVKDKQQWHQTNFVIADATVATDYTIGMRRTLYFKQLAKYCHDLGCRQFGVVKDQFWRSPWRRQPEHIIWARF